jgi:TatD DNase family protein
MRFVDAHNHLQDERLSVVRDSAIAECASIGVRRAVVNGTHPHDWRRVADLAERYSWILPSFGVHPWHIDDLPSDYVQALCRYLDERTSVIGEIGIDHWRDGLDRGRQEEVFLTQLSVAIERNLPVTIHGLKAWRRLLELLRAHGVPPRGFLLHSYSGPVELVSTFANLGAYFSVAPAFFAPQRRKKLEVFRHVPIERILPETDAPDQGPSDELNLYPALIQNDRKLNHPGNIQGVYTQLSRLLGIEVGELEQRMEENFSRLFD